MHVEYFMYFSDFAKTLSVSKTAANFFMTPQGISRALHTLEKEFGVPLIARSNNKLTLTEAGSLLASDAACIAEDFREAHRHMSSLALTTRGTLEPQVNMEVTAFVSSYILPLMNLCSPRVFPFDLHIRESNIFKILPRTAKEERQRSFSFVSLPEIKKYEHMLENAIQENDLGYIPLLRIPLEALISTSSPLAHIKRLSMTALKEHPVIFYNDPVLFDAVTSIIGKENVVMTTSSYHVMQQELERNHAITFVPAIARAKSLPNATVLKPLTDAFYTKLGFLGTKEAMSDKSVNAVINYVQHYFSENLDLEPFRKTFEMV